MRLIIVFNNKNWPLPAKQQAYDIEHPFGGDPGSFMISESEIDYVFAVKKNLMASADFREVVPTRAPDPPTIYYNIDINADGTISDPDNLGCITIYTGTEYSFTNYNLYVWNWNGHTPYDGMVTISSASAMNIGWPVLSFYADTSDTVLNLQPGQKCGWVYDGQHSGAEVVVEKNGISHNITLYTTSVEDPDNTGAIIKSNDIWTDNLKNYELYTFNGNGYIITSASNYLYPIKPEYI